MKAIGLVDGKIVDINANVVPLEDRGHQFGDGVYEVTRVYKGKPFALKEHLARLERSLDGLRIPLPFSLAEISEFHSRLIEESDAVEAAIYIQITRGVAPRAHWFPDNVTPRLTMTIRPARDLGPIQEKGGAVVLVPDERWMRCNIKSINLLGNILAKQVAQEKGCFEAVLVRDAHVTEGSSSNIFAVKDGVLYTHPTTNLILPGITRRIVIDILTANGYIVKEEPFTPAFLMTADEVFLTGTSTEVMPITQIDETTVGNGAIGPVSKFMVEQYKKRIAVECGI